MFHVQGTFEQSLRCGDELSPGGTKTLAALAKIHKHCTGKAHAHGCVDTKPNPLAKSDSNTSMQSKKSFRSDCFIEIKDTVRADSPSVRTDSPFSKNNGSIGKSFSNSTSSYEGHSDTDSETTFKSRSEHKSTDPCERLFSQNTKASLLKTARMRYADDNTISTLQDEIDGEKWKNTFVRTPSRGSFREKKSGVVTIEEVKFDGAKNSDELCNYEVTDEKKKNFTPNKNIILRKSSPGTVNGKNSPVGVSSKPPWRGASKNGISNEPFVRSPSLRGSIRKKKNDGVPWRRLYDLSLWRKCGVNFALNGADSERALLRPWSELSSQLQPPSEVSCPFFRPASSCSVFILHGTYLVTFDLPSYLYRPHDLEYH